MVFLGFSPLWFPPLFFYIWRRRRKFWGYFLDIWWFLVIFGFPPCYFTFQNKGGKPRNTTDTQMSRRPRSSRSLRDSHQGTILALLTHRRDLEFRDAAPPSLDYILKMITPRSVVGAQFPRNPGILKGFRTCLIRGRRCDPWTGLRFCWTQKSENSFV